VPAAGWAGWLMAKLRRRDPRRPRLRLLERIALAPRQSLALIEAEGRRFLVATSADGAPAFFPLDGYGRERGPSSPRPGNAERGSLRTQSGARLSW